MRPGDIQDDGNISSILKSYMRAEINQPLVQEHKRALVRSFLGESPRPIFGLELAVPALALCLLFVVFQFAPVIRSSKSISANTAQQVQLEWPASEVLQITKDPAALPYSEASPVIVKKVSSQTGSTMVYQTSHSNSPVTIIWVFNARSR